MARRVGYAPHQATSHSPFLDTAAVAGGGVGGNTKDKWVNVTWMPHTALSQKSHVCLSIRSAHAVLDPLNAMAGMTNPSLNESPSMASDFSFQGALPEWRIRMGIYGVGGLSLLPIPLHSTSSPLQPAAKVRMGRRQNPSSSDAASSSGSTTAAARENAMHMPASSGNSFTTVDHATHDCVWDYFVTIPIRWRDLPRDAYLQFEVLEHADRVVYQTVLPFFSQYGRLATGLQKLELSSSPLDHNRNHGLVGPSVGSPTNPTTSDADDGTSDTVWKAAWTLDTIGKMEERTRVNPLLNETFGQIPSVPWLDAMVKERATSIIQEALADTTDPTLLSSNIPASLIVELPTFDVPIVYEETFYPVPQHGVCGAVAPTDWAAHYRRKASEQQQKQYGLASGYGDSKGSGGLFDPLQLVLFLDYENESDNPVEDKYRTLAHDLLRGLVDPALKPDREQRHRLANIIDSPSHHPTREEKDLLWRFRFSLVDNRRALTKFLLAVDWTVESEVVQAAELLEQWRMRSPIDVTDALKLLGKNVAFQTNLVRDYAIDTLALAPDSELRLYLLQLVQALKYENLQMTDGTTSSAAGAGQSRVGGSDNGTSPGSTTTGRVSSLAAFLINRAAGNIQLANYLYWYLKVELENSTYVSRYREVFEALEERLSATPCSMAGLSETIHPSSTDSVTPFKSIVDSVSKLGLSSLRKSEPPASGTTSSITTTGSGTIGDKATKKGPKERSMWQVLVEQDSFLSGVLDIQQRCRDLRGKKDAKEIELKSLLSKEGYGRNQTRDLIPLPSRPDIFVNGVVPESAIMFKSALYPALLEFNVDGVMASANKPASASDLRLTSYRVIVKTGDDLRQDQLIIMMIQLMDGLFKRGALDLCLTPYSVIATSPTSGLVEFVDRSMPISQVLSKFNGSIMQYFQAAAPQTGARYGVRPDVMSAYVRSCAGYCVITYLLGVGDRHLDNIMLRSTGHFFHIDFGFIFGRDPKPLPPAFRLTREMVDGMGGLDSSEYRQFCSLSCQAYNALRKSAGLILNLLSLMSDAGIEDLSNNASSNAEGVLAKVEERFRLDLSDEQAERFFIGLINDCLAAIAPRVMDVFHSIAVARR